jgi:hypothetical protein
MIQKAMEQSTIENKKTSIHRLKHSKICTFLKEWLNSPSLVFFDFQDSNELLLLYPETSSRGVYLEMFPRDSFIKIFHDIESDKIVKSIAEQTNMFLSQEKKISQDLQNYFNSINNISTDWNNRHH